MKLYAFVLNACAGGEGFSSLGVSFTTASAATSYLAGITIENSSLWG